VHELGLCDAIVAATLRRADGRRVSGVRVRVGGHPVDPDVINQGFRLAAMGTLAEQASVDLVLEPLTATCRDCRTASPVTDSHGLAVCPRCGGVDVEVSGRDAVVLESITFELTAPGGAAAGSERRSG
jgi:hydrogenase nickel incorporation protein HypA/HybF